MPTGLTGEWKRRWLLMTGFGKAPLGAAPFGDRAKDYGLTDFKWKETTGS